MRANDPVRASKIDMQRTARRDRGHVATRVVKPGITLRIALLGAVIVAVGIGYRWPAKGQSHDRPDDHWTCGALSRPDSHQHFLAGDDIHPPVAPVDGAGLLVLCD